MYVMAQITNWIKREFSNTFSWMAIWLGGVILYYCYKADIGILLAYCSPLLLLWWVERLEFELKNLREQNQARQDVITAQREMLRLWASQNVELSLRLQYYEHLLQSAAQILEQDCGITKDGVKDITVPRKLLH